MEDESQLSEIDLAKKMELESFEDSIWTIINKMKDAELEENEFNKMLFKLDRKTGDVSICFASTEVNFATVHTESGLEYNISAIKAYKRFIEHYGIEDELPEGFPDIDTLAKLSERTGENMDSHDKENGEKTLEKDKTAKTEDKVEDNPKKDDNGEKKTAKKIKPGPNSIKVNLNRFADMRVSLR